MQQYTDLGDYGGGVRPVLGVWTVDMEPAGLGIREPDGLMTDNTRGSCRTSSPDGGARRVLELVVQVLAYSGVGLVMLFVGLHRRRPAHAGQPRPTCGGREPERRPPVGLRARLAGADPVVRDLLHGRGLERAGRRRRVRRRGRRHAGRGFLVLDVLIPGKLLAAFEEQRMQPGTWVAAALHVAVALVVSASLT